MAKRVIASIVGGEEVIVKDVSTVAQVKAALGVVVKNYGATVNGEPADDSYQLEEKDFVAFSPQVKGA